MRNYRDAFYKIVSIFFLGVVFYSPCAWSSDLEWPKYLEKKGLSRPAYDPHAVNLGRANPLLAYDLSDEKVETMRFQYQAAKSAEDKGGLNPALRQYLFLAESGYGPANKRLAEAFEMGELGLKADYWWSIFYSDRPQTVEKMKEKKKSLLEAVEWQEKREMEFLEERAAATLAVRASAVDASLSLDDVKFVGIGGGKNGASDRRLLLGDKDNTLRRRTTVTTH